MKRMLPVLCAAMALGFTLAGCGGGDGSGGLAPENLAGSWFGHGAVPVRGMTFFAFGIEVNDSGDITDVLIDGSSSGWTGAVTASTASGNVFEAAMSNGSRAIIMSDGTATHFAFIDKITGIVGVLQKGATSLPAFADTDMVGSWSGYSIETDSSFGIIAAGASSVTVASDLTFEGNGLEGGFTGDFFDSAAPMWGTFLGDTGTDLMVVHLCPDKTFAGSFECGSEPYLTFPACTFSVMAK